jgi:hypothetical protein
MATPHLPRLSQGVASVPPSEPSTMSIISRHARTCRRAAWAEIHDRTRPPVGIGFAPEMIGLRSCRTFTSSEKPMTAYLISLALIGLIAIAVWGMFVSAEIILLMPRPRHDSEQTDFPAIAFRTAAPDIATDQRVRPDDIASKPRMLNSEDRTSSIE